jgi:hypothetical protein
MVPQKQYEPVAIVQGDTVSFTRYFGNFPASGGWSLLYTMTMAGQPAIEFTSTANGTAHVILVTAAVTETWTPGEYVLEGFAVNSGTSERQKVYQNYLKVTPDTATATDVNQTTHAQRMVALIESVQEGKFNHDILNSDVEGTRIMRLQPKELREEYLYWLQRRREEIHRANSLIGRSDGRNRFTVFTDPAGQGIGQFGALPPIFPYGGGLPE